MNFLYTTMSDRREARAAERKRGLRIGQRIRACRRSAATLPHIAEPQRLRMRPKSVNSFNRRLELMRKFEGWAEPESIKPSSSSVWQIS